jgi:hypothetical protein
VLLLVGVVREHALLGLAKTDPGALRPVRRHVRGRELGVHDLLQRPAQPLATEPGRVVHPGQPGVEPSPDELHPLGRRRVVRGEERGDLTAQVIRAHPAPSGG